MPLLKFKNPLRTSGSDGFQTSIVDQDGTVSTINVFSIGQEVGTDSDVQFDSVTQPESETAVIGTDSNNMVLGYGFISGSNLTFTVDEQGISENYTHLTDITINGDINAGSIIAEEENSTIINTSGSTKFGNSTDDIHHITGSFNLSGSLKLNGHSGVGNVTDNTDLSAARTDYFVTERVAKIVIGGDAVVNSEYLRKIFAKRGTLTNTTASFSAVTASIDTGLTATNLLDFQFYINGMLMEYDALNIQQNGSNLELHIDEDSLGHTLSSDDEIIAWGKFNS
tara:strand:+ start:392 stop:1237 length:846 start_codon:yes stop_codon:yes gene_type:complete